MDPAFAKPSIREAKPVECPIGVYSVRRSSLRMERSTTSPVFTPTRISTGARPVSRSRIRILANLRLHAQGGIEGSLGMIFMGNRRAKEGKDAVASRLHDVAFVAMDRRHHELQGGIDEGAGFLGVE